MSKFLILKLRSPFRLRFIFVFISIILLLSVSCGKTGSQGEKIAETASNGTEILWDTWGVPHVFAKDIEGLFYAYGWSQMQSHGDLILKLYGEARGRAAEYWGETNLQSDIYIRTMGVPQRAKTWFKANNPNFQKYLSAFAQGMNDYADNHKESLDKKRLPVLPVLPEDILAHTQRVLYLHFLGFTSQRTIDQWEKSGSNGWAIAPSHSENGHAMLLTNPHLPWSDFFLLYEAHLNAPGINAYGVTFVGMPMPIMAFNDYLGWTHTVNVNDGADIFELKLSNNGYLLDGQEKAFQTETQTLKIKTESGEFRKQKLVIENSVFGPVLAKKGDKALTLKIAGLDRPLIWEQRYDMVRATNLQEFEAAWQRLQEPMLNVMYADRDGHILLMHNAILPKRSHGDWDYWQGIIPGDKSESLWQGYHPYEDLPRVVDPANGWVQNCNQPIWSGTYPLTLKSEDYVDYVTIPAGNYGKYSNNCFRTLRSLRMLHEDQKISFQELVEYKFSTRMEMADRLLDDLIPAAQTYGSDIAKEAAKVLQNWDRQTEAQSRGAVLFEAWVKEMKGEIFAKEWEADKPFTTPDGLKNPQNAAAALDKAAQQVKENYGALDVPWGEVKRIKYAGKNLPGNGGPGRLGVFRSMYYYPDEEGIQSLVMGDTYVAVVEFSNPVKAMVVLGYGNASQPDSPHFGDQISMVVEKKLRPALLIKNDILKHLEKKEVL